jgi:hypothetical protein
MLKLDEDASEVDEGGVVDEPPFPPRADPSNVLQPSEQALDFTPPLVVSQGSFVLHLGL